MNLNDKIEKLRAYWLSPEGIAEMEADHREWEIQAEKDERRAKRFAERFGSEDKFRQLVFAVERYYNTDKYRDKWFRAGQYPPETLYDDIRKYAFANGTECTEEETTTYLGRFDGLVKIHNIIIGHAYGQGEIIIKFHDTKGNTKA